VKDESQDVAAVVRAVHTVRWHRPTSVALMPWRVLVDGTVIAVFVKERDARGFAKARYGDEAIVVPRFTRRTPALSVNRQSHNEPGVTARRDGP